MDKNLKMSERRTNKDDKKEELINNVSYIPEIMKVLNHSNL